MPVERLRDMQCEHCAHTKGPVHDCDGIVLGARCHPGLGVTVTYKKSNNTLEVVCAICQSPVVTLQLPPPAN
jgi:hypothetical protein